MKKEERTEEVRESYDGYEREPERHSGKGSKKGGSVGICVLMAIIAAAALLLFLTAFFWLSKSAEGNVHLSAGKLNIGFYKTGFTSYSMDENGVMTEVVKDSVKTDLGKDSDKVFEISGAVPTDRYKADFQIDNRSNIPADCSIKILWNSETAAADELAFAGQLKITVTAGGSEQGYMLTEIAGMDISLGAISAREEGRTFSVTVEFTDGENNNAAKNSDIEFDIQLLAVQRA